MHPVQSIKMPKELSSKIEAVRQKCLKLEPGMSARLTWASVLRAMLEMSKATPQQLVEHVLNGGLKRGNPHKEKKEDAISRGLREEGHNRP